MKKIEVGIETGSREVRDRRACAVHVTQGQPLDTHEQVLVHKALSWLIKEIAGPDATITIEWPRT